MWYQGNSDEIKILKGQYIDCDPNNILYYLSTGRYIEGIKDKRCLKYLPSGIEQFSAETLSRHIIEVFHNTCSEDSQLLYEKQLEIFSLAISCLNIFVQNNWTGPLVEFDLLLYLQDVSSQKLKQTKDNILQDLDRDGQSVYPLVKNIELFLVSYVLFFLCNGCLSFLKTLKWWQLRCLCIYQQLLDAKAASIRTQVLELLDSLSKEDDIFQDSELKILYHLEAGYICYDVLEYSKGQGHFIDAENSGGLQVQLTGVLGKRTKFQEDEKSQLVLVIEKSDAPSNCNVELSPDRLPKNVLLDDDVVLERIQFSDGNYSDQSPPITALDGLIILGLMENRRRQQAHTEILHSELMAYLTNLIENSRVWNVQFNALFHRSLLECNSSRRIDRSISQLEELRASVIHKDPDNMSRLLCFYACRSPPTWIVQSKLANLMAKMGAVSSALEIYENLQLWDDAILCCQRLGKTQKAECMIREQLAVEETANLYCFLGDVTGTIEHYEKAWEMSGHRCTKAQRCLGYHYLNKQQLQKSLDCFKKSLQLNSLQISVWFTYGCCAMTAEQYALAVKAFHQCVSLDYDNFEAWSNLATCFVKLGQKQKAFKVLQDSLKCNYDNWRLWENCLIIGTDCKEYVSVIHSYHRLLDLRDKWTDVQILTILVNAIISDSPDSSGKPSGHLLQKTLELFGRITSKVTSNGDIWRLYGKLSSSLPDSHETRVKILQCLQKFHRCFCMAKDWEKDIVQCRNIVAASEELANAYWMVSGECSGTESLGHLSSCKLMLKNTITKIQSSIDQGLLIEGQADEDIDITKIKQLLEKTVIKLNSLKT